MSSPRREVKKESEKHNKEEDEENPTNVEPRITESYDND